MTVLVTGSSGHLGEALVRSLRTANRPVRGLDLNPSPFTDFVGSICDRDFVGRCMAEATSVIHAATLHKPHLVTHTSQDFVDTNITGTLVLLEAAVSNRISAFVFTSTTSAFGSALRPGPSEAATWITEDVASVPKNLYGVTKIAAENLCELFARKQALPVVILRTSRFFPEPDDDPAVRERYQAANVQANEMLYRRVDLEDAVSAHLLAIECASRFRFRRYIVSATTPFSRDDLSDLRANAARVVRQKFPNAEPLFLARGWALVPEIDRVYINALARRELGWEPKYDFQHVLHCLRTGDDFRSPLARTVGIKGYHDQIFSDGIYPVA